jgi:hypothetical protein
MCLYESTEKASCRECEQGIRPMTRRSDALKKADEGASFGEANLSRLDSSLADRTHGLKAMIVQMRQMSGAAQVARLGEGQTAASQLEQ